MKKSMKDIVGQGSLKLEPTKQPKKTVTINLTYECIKLMESRLHQLRMEARPGEEVLNKSTYVEKLIREDVDATA